MQDLFYHYTSLDVLFKLLDGIHDDKLIFRATNILSQNDSNEFKYGYNKVLELLPEIESYLKIEDNNIKLSKIWSTAYYYEAWREQMCNVGQDYFRLPFTISFSQNIDILYQWYMYGDRGFGAALGFKGIAYWKEVRDDKGMIIYDTRVPYPTDSMLHPISYEKVFMHEYPGMKVLELYRQYLNEIKTEREVSLKQKIQALSDIMFNVASFVKAPCFRLEKEYRMIAFRDESHDVQFDIKPNKSIRPYIEVEFPIYYLSNIIIGPCSDQMAERCIKYKLQQKGINQHINIYKSNIPYVNQ